MQHSDRNGIRKVPQFQKVSPCLLQFGINCSQRNHRDLFSNPEISILQSVVVIPDSFFMLLRLVDFRKASSHISVDSTCDGFRVAISACTSPELIHPHKLHYLHAIHFLISITPNMIKMPQRGSIIVSRKAGGLTHATTLQNERWPFEIPATKNERNFSWKFSCEFSVMDFIRNWVTLIPSVAFPISRVCLMSYKHVLGAQGNCTNSL